MPKGFGRPKDKVSQDKYTFDGKNETDRKSGYRSAMENSNNAGKRKKLLGGETPAKGSFSPTRSNRPGGKGAPTRDVTRASVGYASRGQDDEPARQRRLGNNTGPAGPKPRSKPVPAVKGPRVTTKTKRGK